MFLTPPQQRVREESEAEPAVVKELEVPVTKKLKVGGQPAVGMSTCEPCAEDRPVFVVHHSGNTAAVPG